MTHTYPNQQDALLAKVKGKTGKISDKTHEEHLKLYTGYVNKSNGILAEIEKLGVPDPANPAVANQIFSTVRAHRFFKEERFPAAGTFRLLVRRRCDLEMNGGRLADPEKFSGPVQLLHPGARRFVSHGIENSASKAPSNKFAGG